MSQSVIHIRPYIWLEGEEFWKDHALSNTFNMKNFDSNVFKFKDKDYNDLTIDEMLDYLKVKSPRDLTVNGKMVFVKNRWHTIKLFPTLYVDIMYGIGDVFSVTKYVVNYNLDTEVFFSLSSFKEYITHIVKGLNLSKYMKYTFNPLSNNKKYLLSSPFNNMVEKYPQFDVVNHDIISDSTKSLLSIFPIEVISNFNKLDDYQKSRIVKNMTGSKSLDPKENLKFATPMFINPKTTVVSFSPYIDDETQRLRELLTLFEQIEDVVKNTNLSYLNMRFHGKHYTIMQQIYTIERMIKELITKEDNPISRLDILFGIIHGKVELFNLLSHFLTQHGIGWIIYGYTETFKDSKNENGLYVARINGEVKHLIYHMKFPTTLYIRFPENSSIGYVDIFPLLKGDLRNLYYTIDSNTFYQVKSRYIVFKNWKEVSVEENQPNNEQMVILDTSKIFSYTMGITLHLFRRRIHANERMFIQFDNDLKEFCGTIRAKGELVLQIYENVVLK